MVYQIRLEGHLGDQWQEWFGGLSITREDHGVTLLCGPVVDQAALHGLLKKVRDLGAPLISLRRVELGEAGADGTAHPAPIEAEDHRHSPKDPCP